MMSNPNNTPDKPSNKQKHNRESITKTVEREYETIAKDDLEEPNEEIQGKELNESSVLVDSAGVPNPSELEIMGKPFGTLGSVGKNPERDSKGRAVKAETKEDKAKKGKVVDNGYILVPDTGKIVEDEGK